MPELRPVETTRYSTARPVFMPLVSDFPPPVPYLSLVTCHVKGKQRYFYPPRAFIPPGRNSGVERIRRIPFVFAPADPCLTRPSRILFYFIFSCIYIRQGRTPLFTIIFTGLFRFPLRHRRPVSSCKGRLPRLIRRLEVHSLQILPFCERVIGRENRRMKPCRQSCTASVKSRNGSGREKNRKRVKNRCFT